jgi:hypothetical protein
MTSTGNGLDDDCDSATDNDVDNNDDSTTGDDLDDDGNGATGDNNDGECATTHSTMMATARRATKSTTMAI